MITGILSTLWLLAITSFGLYSVYRAGYRARQKEEARKPEIEAYHYITMKTVTTVYVAPTKYGDMVLNPN